MYAAQHAGPDACHHDHNHDSNAQAVGSNPPLPPPRLMMLLFVLSETKIEANSMCVVCVVCVCVYLESKGRISARIVCCVWYAAKPLRFLS